MNSKAIYDSLLAAVGAAEGLVTVSDKLRHWSDVPYDELPALFLARGNRTATPQTNLPTKWTLEANLWLYVSTADVDSPGEAGDPIFDQIAATLAFSPYGYQTLGGLVQWARIEGVVETSEGTLGDREVLKIPVKMLVA